MKMKKKWLVMSAVVLLGLLGALPFLPDLARFWLTHRPEPTMTIGAAMRTQTIDTLAARLNQHYVFPEKAKAIEALLRQRQKAGAYDATSDARKFADQLDADVASVAHDLHMGVWFSARVVPPDIDEAPDLSGRTPPPHAANPILRLLAPFALGRERFGVEKVEHLSPKLGYLQLLSFAPPALSEAQLWTDDALKGRRYGGRKPVFILVDHETKSASEDFAYAMQAMKRATIVGSRTWGGAHAARPYRLGDHFIASVPDARFISPVTHTNWEGTGIIPDVEAAPADALEVAQDLLQRRTRVAALH